MNFPLVTTESVFILKLCRANVTNNWLMFVGGVYVALGAQLRAIGTD